MKFFSLALISTTLAAVLPTASGETVSSVFTPEQVQILADLNNKSFNETVAHFNMQIVYTYEHTSTGDSSSLDRRYWNRWTQPRWGLMAW